MKMRFHSVEEEWMAVLFRPYCYISDAAELRELWFL
jgi:hypothetical protein